MRFERVTIPAVDPGGLREWYADTLGVDTADSGVELGETTLRFRSAVDAGVIHLAVRTPADIDELTAWLAERATILPVEGAQSRRFDFLNADAVYVADPAGNVLECLCYDGDAAQPVADAAPLAGVTEVGLPARETLALVDWLASSVGLAAWGSPSESFAWVGDREARFVVLPTGSEWYPTERAAGIEPLGATVVDDDATPGTHAHPELPYEVTVLDYNSS